MIHNTALTMEIERNIREMISPKIFFREKIIGTILLITNDKREFFGLTVVDQSRLTK